MGVFSLESVYIYLILFATSPSKRNLQPKNFSFKRQPKKYNSMLVINLIISLSVFNIINFLTSVFLRWIKQVEVLFLKAENVFCILSHSFFRRNIIVVLKMEEFQEEQRACYTLISKEVKMTHQNRAFWTFYIYIYIYFSALCKAQMKG